MEFNRIAGPDAVPGVYTGVLIARINTDIGLNNFEMAVRDLVADIETQYWELYFAYRDLDAKLAARNRALETWRRIRALYETGRLGGEAEKEAQARLSTSAWKRRYRTHSPDARSRSPAATRTHFEATTAYTRMSANCGC